MIVKFLKFILLMHYAFCEKYYSHKDGFYIRYSSKYWDVSKSFTIYYLENNKYLCFFPGKVIGKRFVIDLNSPEPMNREDRNFRNLDFQLIQKRVRDYLKKYGHSIEEVGTA